MQEGREVQGKSGTWIKGLKCWPTTTNINVNINQSKYSQQNLRWYEQYHANQAELFLLPRSFIIIWDWCCCIEVNICWKLCICPCCCLVCSSKIFITSWCCFLDWSSRLPSTSTRCFCSCHYSSFHFWTRTLFSRKYAIVSPLLLRLFCFGFAFSSSSFRCLFCVLPKLSRASTAFALSTFFLSFSTVSSAATSFFGYFFQSLFHLT